MCELLNIICLQQKQVNRRQLSHYNSAQEEEQGICIDILQGSKVTRLDPTWG